MPRIGQVITLAVSVDGGDHTLSLKYYQSSLTGEKGWCHQTAKPTNVPRETWSRAYQVAVSKIEASLARTERTTQ